MPPAGGPISTSPIASEDIYLQLHLKAAIEGSKSVESDVIVKWMEKNPYDGVLANYNAITDKDHTVIDVNQITLTTIGSFDPANVPFQRRAPGL